MTHGDAAAGGEDAVSRAQAVSVSPRPLARERSAAAPVPSPSARAVIRRPISCKGRKRARSQPAHERSQSHESCLTLACF